ncbi:MAG: Dna2/Cas4 domain-containing protein, partial [Methanobrevibacter sp.]|nr:Dna2/Cas4 domain-containing protein [Methanobrevibacter sp.]
KIAEVDDNDALFETGRQVGELAKGLFGDYEDIPFDKNRIMVEKTEELIKDKPNVITEASFSYDNNFCRVDILKNDSDGVEIYEVKSSTEIKDIYLDDISYQYFVLSNLGLNVKKACIVYINKEYIRGKELDIEQLFNIDDVTDIAIEKQDEIRDEIDLINEYMEEHGRDNEPVRDIGDYCFNPYSCAFWKYCTRDLPQPNVFDISGMQTRTKLK